MDAQRAPYTTRAISARLESWIEYQKRLAQLVDRRPAGEVYADRLWESERLASRKAADLGLSASTPEITRQLGT